MQFFIDRALFNYYFTSWSVLSLTLLLYVCVTQSVTSPPSACLSPAF